MKVRLKLPVGLDYILFILPLILGIFSVAVIFSLTYGTKSHIAIDQSIFIILGFMAAIGLALLDYRTLKGLYIILYIIGIFLLILVLFFGTTTFGATRWINLYIFQLQPSEIFKIIIIIITAKYFSDWKDLNWKKWILILFLVALPIILILRQPDLGTAAVIFFTLIVMLFISPMKKIFLAIGLSIIIILSPLGWHFLKQYQKNRVVAFINPAADPQGAGYNVNQARIAVGSGGLWGTGFGKGSQSRLNFLPVAHTDFIFAGTAEATGFIGSTFLILIITFLILRIFYIAKIAKDNFGMYLAIGIGTIFLFQSLINIGMNLGIMPVTGIPLPFVSYGGSAMLTNMAAIGILQSIYLRHKKIAF